MKAHFTGIYNLFTTGPPTIYTNVGGRFYLTEAPQNTTFPYIVYYVEGNDYDYQFVEDFEDFIIQFNIFDDDVSSASNIGTYFENLKSLFDWSTPTIAGYTVVRFVRQFATLARDDEVWQYTIQYQVLLEKN